MSELNSKAHVVAGVILFSLLFMSFSFSDNVIHASAPSSSPPPTPTIFADFAVSASAGPGGSISPSGDQFAYPGSSLIFTITPNSGYRISNVMVDGISKGPISSYRFDNVQSSHEISATFATDTTLTPAEFILIALLVIVAGFSIVVILKRTSKRKRES